MGHVYVGSSLSAKLISYADNQGWHHDMDIDLGTDHFLNGISIFLQVGSEDVSYARI